MRSRAIVTGEFLNIISSVLFTQVGIMQVLLIMSIHIGHIFYIYIIFTDVSLVREKNKFLDFFNQTDGYLPNTAKQSSQNVFNYGLIIQEWKYIKKLDMKKMYKTEAPILENWPQRSFKINTHFSI